MFICVYLRASAVPNVFEFVKPVLFRLKRKKDAKWNKLCAENRPRPRMRSRKMATDWRSRRQGNCKNEPNLPERTVPKHVMLRTPTGHVGECRPRSRNRASGTKITRNRRFEKTNPILRSEARRTRRAAFRLAFSGGVRYLYCRYFLEVRHGCESSEMGQ